MASILLDISSPKEIYSTILNEVDELLLSFEKQEKDEEIQKVREEALRQLNVSRKEIQDSISQLEKNAEWDVFTIAFYGETNAGKSTLIETLRVLFSEPEKIKERREFNRLHKEYHGIEKDIEECENNISAIEDEYNEKIGNIESQLQAIFVQSKKNSREITLLKNEIDELENTAKIDKKTSVANFFYCLFGILPSQKKAKECKRELAEKENDVAQAARLKDDLSQSKEKLNDELDRQTKEHKENKTQLKHKAKRCSGQLVKYVDGRIIGDGSSDFTRNVVSYKFRARKQSFALLDLPGIEGNEGPVLKKINMAVQKAHAVFYVTGKPTPPQTGDGKNKGTLEKVKMHLGQQTEVFTVFNKRVKNPNSLKDGLVDEDETSSLKVLDKMMRDHLGEQYQKCISLSAYPAFLSVANCWKNEHEEKKKKFMIHFESSRRLMEKTNVKSFSSWLTTDIINNCKAKIKRSNFKKAVTVLNHTTESLKQIHSNFIEFQQKLIETKKAADAQLDISMERLSKRLDAESHSAIEKFKSSVRKSIYKDIENEINNDEFKIAFKEHSEKAINRLQSFLEENFNLAIEDFKHEVSQVINTYQKYAAELLRVYRGANKFDGKFELNINIKNGVNLKQLMSTAIGLALGVIILIIARSNLLVVVLTILGGLIDIYKMLARTLNPEIRKSHQRKAAEEKIAKMETEILNKIRENLADAHKPLRSEIENIKNELTETTDRVKLFIAILEKSKSKLAKLALAVKTEGDH